MAARGARVPARRGLVARRSIPGPETRAHPDGDGTKAAAIFDEAHQLAAVEQVRRGSERPGATKWCNAARCGYDYATYASR